MVDKSDNQDYPLPKKGEEVDNWGDVIVEELIEPLEERTLIVDVEDQLTSYTPYEDGAFLAADTRRVFFGDGSAWQKVGGEDNPISGTTHMESIDVESATVENEPTEDNHAVRQADIDDLECLTEEEAFARRTVLFS